jgi:hypothetical protein
MTAGFNENRNCTVAQKLGDGNTVCTVSNSHSVLCQSQFGIHKNTIAKAHSFRNRNNGSEGYGFHVEVQPSGPGEILFSVPPTALH